MKKEKLPPPLKNYRHTFRLKPEHTEQVSKKDRVSQTVPDETMSLREILNKFVRNQQAMDELYRPASGYQDEPDHDSPDLQALSNLDPMEKADYARDLKTQNLEKVDALRKAREKARRDFETANQTTSDGGTPPSKPKASEGAKEPAQKPKASPKPAQGDPKASGLFEPEDDYGG